MPVLRNSEWRSKISRCGLWLAACASIACSDDADATAALDALHDSSGIDAGDLGDQSRASSDAARWQMPGLDPALCGVLPAMDWMGAKLDYTMTHSGSTVTAAIQDKNWYLLTLLQSAPYRKALNGNAGIQALSQSRSIALHGAPGPCGKETACTAKVLSWTSQEIVATAKQATAVLAVTDLVQKHLRPSGVWAHYAALEDTALLTHAVQDTMEQVQRVYAEREANRVDLADAVTAIAASHALEASQTLFFEPILWLALDGLQHSQRTQAGLYEPLAGGENAAALAEVQETAWKDWRFGLILVPGWGPTDLTLPLSELGREHCDLAATRWKAKVAPFVLVSGGHVHPDDTPYSEALEMKKYLIGTHGLPASAVIVDPHARHTTTNLRNAGRLALQMGIPVDKPLLTTTDLMQSFYITILGKRCLEELGYLPWRLLTSLGENDNCWLPAGQVLTADPRDERDP